jgi:GNAT superfamily N-acetyltransferase
MPGWRPADAGDDDAIVAMSLALYGGDPPVSEAQIRATLAMFRDQPVRGRALMLDPDGEAAGYAFLVSFWSNELGGEICTIDELYVAERWRSRGYSTQLINALRSGSPLWPGIPMALELEVSPTNQRARMLYERLGFTVKRNTTMRLHVRP